MAIRNVDGDTFKTLLAQSEQPIFVKFGAGWCGPCEAMAPTLADLAQQYDAITFVEIDVDDAPEIADQYQVRGIPAYLILRHGEVVARDHSQQSRAYMAQFIDSALKSETPS